MNIQIKRLNWSKTDVVLIKDGCSTMVLQMDRLQYKRTNGSLIGVRSTANYDANNSKQLNHTKQRFINLNRTARPSYHITLGCLEPVFRNDVPK